MNTVKIAQLATVTPEEEGLVLLSQNGTTRNATIKELRGVVNDLTIGGAEKSLSAECGKILNLKIDDILNPLNISLTIQPSVVEIGSTVNSVITTWAYSKGIISQIFEDEILDVDLRTKTYTNTLTSNKTFTLSATTAGENIITKTATLSFCNGIYYGTSSNTVYDDTLINSFTRVLSNTRNRTISVNAGSGEYIYYILPSTLGIPVFTVGGFSGGFSKVATIAFTNRNLYTANYDFYRSDNASLGPTAITIT
jgi:hypothetical protein